MTARLIALYDRPADGSPFDETAFEAAYRTEHLPLVQASPGLRGLRVWRVERPLGGESSLFLVAEMDFDDEAGLDAAIASEPMRQAGRSLRRIAPGPVTMLVLAEANDLLPGESATD